MEVVWIFYILFVIIGIVFLILFALFFWPQKTVTILNKNTLQMAYDTGDGKLDVEVVTKPFAVQINQQGVHFNAATFTESNLPAFSRFSRVVGNMFKSTQPLTITNLQVVAEYMSRDPQLPPRQLAIYDMITREQIVSGTINVGDVVVDGFYTTQIPVDKQPTIILDRWYAIVALLNEQDFYARTENIIQSSDVVQFGKKTDVLANEIFLPSDVDFIDENPNNLQFASFQYVTLILNQTTFQVDVRSQNATFPLGYVYNLNVQVKEDMVFLEPGVCMSGAQNNNMLNNTIGNLIITPEVVGVANGLDIGTLQPSQWYSVYLITSSVQGMPPAGLLSKNRQMPSKLPIGYESSKRVGWARSDNVSAFLPMAQQGNGTRRQTVYLEPLPIEAKLTFTPDNIASIDYFTTPLRLVTPTCSSVILEFEVENLSGNVLEILLREKDAFFDVVRVATPGNLTSILRVEYPISDFYAPHLMRVALDCPNGFVVNNVNVTIRVVSFYDNL